AEHHHRRLVVVVVVVQEGRGGADGDSLGGTAVQGVGTEPGALALVVGAESVGGKVSSLDLKWAAIRSMSVSWMRTRTCSAGRPMAVVLSVGLSPCWIARSLSGNAATGSKVVSVIRDNGVSSAGLRRCGLDVPGASNRISKLVGMVRRAQAARRCVTDNYASRYGSDRHRVRGAYLHGPVDGRQCGTTRGHRAARPRWARRGVHRVGRGVCAHHRDRSHNPANNYLHRLTATKNLDIHSLSLGSA